MMYYKSVHWGNLPCSRKVRGFHEEVNSELRYEGCTGMTPGERGGGLESSTVQEDSTCRAGGRKQTVLEELTGY